MNVQDEADYNRISKAISYIRENFKNQPTLDEIATHIHLSPFHFQRLFSEWAGVSPKKFLQFLTVEYAKQILDQNANSLFDAAFETGLSGTGRLHDLFITLEGMTPGEYKNGGKNLVIQYSTAHSPFGELFIASTPKGICHLAFIDDEVAGFETLKKKFPNARLQPGTNEMQEAILQFFSTDWTQRKEIKLHLSGTPFQLKVWETLLKIPEGRLSTYHDIAVHMGRQGASRAVGNAIGSNPVAFLIPCHRVIRASGVIGEYRWGSTRKSALIGWEAARAPIAQDA